jgi:hypothetical protein
MSKELFDKVADSITKDHPSFRIRYKSTSRLMGLLAVLAYPFNPGFADGYITTLGSKVYFPTPEDVEQSYLHSAETLAHEGVHIYDAQQHGIWFTLSYMMNQLLILPLLVAFAIVGSWIPVAGLVGGIAVSYFALWLVMKVTSNFNARRWTFFLLAGASGIGYLVLSIWFAKWWAILGVAAFLPLVPVSSLLRAKWEYRGYAMGIAMQYWRTGAVSDSYLDWVSRHFIGPDYYFMDRNKTRVMDRLKTIRADVMNGSFLKQEHSVPYQRTLEVMKSVGMVKAGVASA